MEDLRDRIEGFVIEIEKKRMECERDGHRNYYELVHNPPSLTVYCGCGYCGRMWHRGINEQERKANEEFVRVFHEPVMI